MRWEEKEEKSNKRTNGKKKYEIRDTKQEEKGRKNHRKKIKMRRTSKTKSIDKAE